MKRLLVLLFVLAAFGASAQVYNNEWIDYSKTYYRFRVGKDGVYRISGTALTAAGLGSASAQDFQLWRNGVQVPVYTSAATGALSANDYIEFWGKMNDGKPDKELYRDQNFQISDKWSLINDSSAYFLTVNAGGNNLRLQTTANNVAGNTLPAEPYFMYKAGHYFRDKLNNGFYQSVGHDQLYSSSYDEGEAWTSSDIETQRQLNQTPVYGTMSANYFSNLYPATVGPDPSVIIAANGNAPLMRRYRLTLNGDSVMGEVLPFMTHTVDTATFNRSLLNSGSATIGITNFSERCIYDPCVTVDRMIVQKIEINYSRQFNFGGASNFEFSLPASVAGNYLEITNFSHGGVQPILYDLTNGKRYVGELSSSVVKFALLPSADARNLVLVNSTTANSAAISSFVQRSFKNYNLPAEQADYIIISNPRLFNGSTGNPVEEYRAYRGSNIGGAYNAKIFLDEELIDQFGFGIRKNPAGIRNFIHFARNKFASRPKHVFIIGRGMNYQQQRNFDLNGTPAQKQNLEVLNLVPSWGWPASDNLLAAEPATPIKPMVSLPATSIGRLTAITPGEVYTYLKKIKEYELALQTASPTIGDKAWMKNVAHIAGAGEEPLATQLLSYLNGYKRLAEDSLWGAKVSTFAKTSSNSVELLGDQELTKVFNEGLSLVTYYGHSSPTTLEFNLDEPANYNNSGKYPMFFALGCNAGNTFDYNESRFTQRNYLSDKYVLAPDRGSINFVASSHFGIVHYLDIWNIRAYNNISRTMYGSAVGDIMRKTIEDVYQYASPDDFFARSNAEETILNGDPGIRFNLQLKPDYVIVDTMLKINPNFISVADQYFEVSISSMNLGKATNRPYVIETKRQYPNGTTVIVRRDTLSGTHYRDALSFRIPIDPTRDKGTNRIVVMLDADSQVDEMFENNNTITREFMIFEDEARAIYPYNFAIVNKRDITLKASTADPFSTGKQYRMEIDTTELFNSSLKVTSTITSAGGLLEFQPGLQFQDSTVYYWRVAPVPVSGQPSWSRFSFVYLPNSAFGFNQSHFYQHQKSTPASMSYTQAGGWKYFNKSNNLLIRSGVFPTAASQAAELSIAIDGIASIRSVCGLPNIIVNVFDQNTFKPWLNGYEGMPGQYGSDPICGDDRAMNFQFTLTDTSKRRKLVEFLELIPAGDFVVIRNTSGTDPNNNYFVDGWKKDTIRLGSGRSIYHHLFNQGFTEADSFYKPRAFIFTYKKNAQASVPSKSVFSQGIFDKIALSADYLTPDSVGYLTSPLMGPALTWKEFKWRGTTGGDTKPGDRAWASIVGHKKDGTVDTLVRAITPAQASVSISTISAETYPYLQMHLMTLDSVNRTPYNLNYWRLTYDPIPEGAVTPNIQFSMKDTVDVGEPLNLKLAFKNISDGAFKDSMLLRLTVFDRNNNQRVIPVPKQRSPKNNGDVMNIDLNLDTKALVGANTIYLHINPENDQPEQYQFNNFIFRNFFVRGDTLNPLLDVTFDNVHILNEDVVSSKPNILIKLKDEAKWMLLNDPSVATVQVRYPPAVGQTGSSTVRTFSFNSDTLRFIPATDAPNASNTASIEFKPYFETDGDYELMVTGKDMSENRAGTVSYRVAFKVINKAMISNMLNYPNPFTTSTAFVFTLTGSEVPQNIKIQVLTVTGKVVREILKDELGPLHIGRNITEFKWDGTDQFGQKLANGVYLYRVATNLNGNKLDKYTSPNESTDKYFNKGYGKMYLMR